MRVLFLTHNYPRWSGDFAGAFIRRLALASIAPQSEVAVIAPHHAGAAEEEYDGQLAVARFRYAADDKETVAYGGELNRINVTRMAQLWRVRQFWRAYRVAAREGVGSWNPTVLHAHWWIPGGIMAHGAVKANTVPYIVTVHGTDMRLLTESVGPTRWLLTRWADRVFRQASAITVVSTFLRNKLLEVIPHVENRVTVIPMPPDDSVFVPNNKESQKSDKSVPRILTVTRFIKQKRVEDFVDALGVLFRRGVDFTAEIVGEGTLEQGIRNRIAKAGLREVVTVCAPVAPELLADKYRAADVCVLNSENEGFGMALVEAQLCETAVIGTASGGIIDIIDDGKSGLLVPLRSPDSLADAIALLLGDTARRRELAMAGREAAQQYASASIAGEFNKLYTEVSTE